MPGDHREDTDKSCNVCGATVQIINHAATTCKNSRCDTHDNDNNLGTNSDMEDIAAYYKEQMFHWRDRADSGLSQSELREQAVTAFEDYARASDRVEAETAEIRCETYLEHLDVGWGWCKEEVDL